MQVNVNKTRSPYKNSNRDNKLNCSSCPFHVWVLSYFCIVVIPEGFTNGIQTLSLQADLVYSVLLVSSALSRKTSPQGLLKIKYIFGLF